MSQDLTKSRKLNTPFKVVTKYFLNDFNPSGFAITVAISFGNQLKFNSASMNKEKN
jgi:hypothetical protein